MSLQKAVANALSFAHLAGIGRTKGARAESDDEKDKGDDKKDAKAEDDDEAKAEGDGDKHKDTGGDEDDTKAEKDDGEDDDDKEDDKAAKASAYQAGYTAANSRAATVFASAAAGRNVALAAELVFNSSMSAQQIVNTLALAGGAKGAGLAERMASVKAPVAKAEAEAAPTPEGPKAAAQATVAAILKASAKARGEKA